MFNNVIAGWVSFGFVVLGLFFLKFWRRTQDRLFATFSLAFFLMGAERLVEQFLRITHAESPAVYLIRFLAFALIIAAIVRKNTPK